MSRPRSFVCGHTERAARNRSGGDPERRLGASRTGPTNERHFGTATDRRIRRGEGRMKDLVARLGGRTCHLNEWVVAKYVEAERGPRLRSVSASPIAVVLEPRDGRRARSSSLLGAQFRQSIVPSSAPNDPQLVVDQDRIDIGSAVAAQRPEWLLAICEAHASHQSTANEVTQPIHS